MQKIVSQKKFKNGKELMLVHGNISGFIGDVLINPTNPQMVLTHGTGRKIVQLERDMTDKASNNLTDSNIQTACYRWVQKHGEISAEKPAYILTDELPFQAVIHTVLPAFSGTPEKDIQLWQALVKALDLADLFSMHSVGIPAIPNWPETTAGYYAVHGSADILTTRENDLYSIQLVLEEESTIQIYSKFMEDLLH